ncbi:tryptophan synthase subunit alpha, partial [Candidatus Woesearchaeota archaeon]|nr:tryptophan synthase subunit alpha [Candidatus Woesearchaeota archaeon]
MKLEKKFKQLGKEKAFMAHVYCGDGGVNFSERLIRTLENHIDILELGIPFSDPIADGAVFQQACQRALLRGTTSA